MKYKKEITTSKQRVNLVWEDKEKTRVGVVKHENGKYVIRCDPAFVPNLWQKFWMKFGFYKQYKSRASLLHIDKKVKATQNNYKIYFRENLCKHPKN